MALLAALVLVVLATPPAEAGAARRKPGGVVHVVGPGQTLFRISQAYRVPVATLVAANRLPAAGPLRAGQRLVIPGATKRLAVEPYRPMSREERQRLERSLAEADEAEQAGPETALPSVAPPPGTPRPPASSPPAAAPDFLWPITGPLTSPFGPRAGRLHAGIDIGSPHYQEVRAAADGEVIFVRDGGPGLGTAVVLRHGAGYTTVYGHLSIRIAREAESVRRGQAIGGVGATGNASGPHLHFEIRRGGRPVDPLSLLPPTLDQLVEGLASRR
jgi:murein DD-endopeptidase MepM/ murein hydrolase activator NlpD